MSNKSIDWKSVSKSEGYRSLKAAYVRDVQDDQRRIALGLGSFRGRLELRVYFKKAIGLAMKYAHKNGEDFESFLNRCEQKRTYCWLNYYQNHQIARV